MSLEQVKKEFSFMWRWVNGLHLLLSDDATVKVQVSRLSREALYLSLENREMIGNFQISQDITILNKEGEPVFCRDLQITKSHITIGDRLVQTFPASEQECSEEVAYIVYAYNRKSKQFSRRKGHRADVNWWIKQREVTIFKMPKKKTLWHLIQQYRKAAQQRLD